MQKKHLFLLLLILGIGIFFRLYLIHQMPGGLFPDEAAEGLDAQNILHGHLQAFYERGNGREGLYYYLLAPVIYFFGSGFWQLHVVSAIIGILSLVGTYLFVSRLVSKNVALLATFLMAISTWHIVLSRTAFRAILIPFFISFGFYFLLRVFQSQTNKERLWTSILAGAFLAGGFYSYIAYRIVAAIIGIIAFLLLCTDARQKFAWVKQYWRSGLAGLAAFIIVFAPLGYYFASHPGSFVGRSGQVSIFNKELNHGNLVGTLGDVFGKSIKAYFADGDLNWRHNISGLPFLPPLVSIFFGPALIIITLLAAKYVWQALFSKPNLGHLKYLILAGLFWGTLVPVITTAEGIPHGLRSIGTIPAVFIITAIGMAYFARKVMDVWHYVWMERLYKFVAVLFFATLTFVSYTQYFAVAYTTPENFYAFRSDLTAVSAYLNNHPDKFHNYLVLDLFSEQTPQYMTDQTQPYIIVDPASAYKLHAGADDRIIFAASTLFDQKTYQQHNQAVIKEIAPNKFGTFDMVVLQPQKSTTDKSLSVNEDGSFWTLNFGDRIYWDWKNQSMDPWQIKIWQCDDANCHNPTLLKDNGQNDFIQNSDYADMDGTKQDLFFKATGYDMNGNVIKDFGIIKTARYK